MMAIHAAQTLADACLRVTRHQPQQVLEWLVDDVLADFGVKPECPPPDDMHDWLLEHSGQYARCVLENPFADVLGEAYEAIASRSRRAGMGQFFTPDAIAQLMGALVTGHDPQHAQAREDGRLWTVCEPACGSGALLLGFLDNLLMTHGLAALQHWSLTAIDLDRLCARMCATQVLSNVFLHVSDAFQKAQLPTGAAVRAGRPGLGELVVYCGNALGPPDRLHLVVHATRRDFSSDLLLPALHPARIAMLRQAQRQTQVDEVGSLASSRGKARSKAKAESTSVRPSLQPSSPQSHPERDIKLDQTAAPSPHPQAEQIDLFAD